MAAIDKTYVSKYSDYKALKEWAEGVEFTAPNGIKFRMSDYLFEWKETDFEPKYQYPVMTTPQGLDYFLIKHCPLEFVQKRMQEVYPDWYEQVKEGKSDYDNFKYVNGAPEGWEKGRKIIWINKPKHNKIVGPAELEMIRECDYCSNPYEDEIGRFVSFDEIHSSFGSYFIQEKTYKALQRKLMKMPLPEGQVFDIHDGYNDHYKLLVL